MVAPLNLLDVHPFEGCRDVRKDRSRSYGKFRGASFPERVSQLLYRPCRCQTFSDRHVDDLSGVVRQDDEDEERRKVTSVQTKSRRP